MMSTRFTDLVGMSRLRAQHGEHGTGCGHGSRTASRRRHERVAQAVKTTAATMSVCRLTELVGKSCPRAQHGERASGGGHGSALRASARRTHGHEPPAHPACRACLRLRTWEPHCEQALARTRGASCEDHCGHAEHSLHHRFAARAASAPSMESMPPASAMGAHCEQAHARTHGPEPPAHPACRACLRLRTGEPHREQAPARTRDSGCEAHCGHAEYSPHHRSAGTSRLRAQPGEHTSRVGHGSALRAGACSTNTWARAACAPSTQGVTWLRTWEPHREQAPARTRGAG